VVALLLGAGLSRRYHEPLRFALELWMGAGLLRLTGDAAWTAIAGAATVVAVRMVASRTLLSRR
jgi:hypothetical protein